VVLDDAVTVLVVVRINKVTKKTPEFESLFLIMYFYASILASSLMTFSFSSSTTGAFFTIVKAFE